MNGLPQGWELKKFTDVFDINGGTQPPKSEFISEPKEGYIRLLQIRDFGAKPVPTYIPDNGKRRVCTEQDILIGRYGASIGRICTGMSGAFNVALARVVKPDYIDSGYLKYFLKSDLFQRPLSMLSRSAQNGFNKKDLSIFDFYQPPLSEQKRIADKLDSVLAKVEAAQARLDKIPTLLKRFRQSILAAATSGELTKEWRERNDIHIANWVSTSVGEVAEVKTGSTPLKSNKSFYINGTVPWLTSTVTGQNLVTKSEKFVTTKAVEDCRLTVFPPGTLLVAMYGEGKTRGQVTELGIEATINQACAAVLVNQLKADSNFVKLTIRSNYEKTRLMAEGGAQPNLNLSKVRAIPVNLPSSKEQSEIVCIVAELFSTADLVEKQYEAAKLRVDKMTQSILARAFSGKLFSPVSEDDREAVAVKTQNSQPKQTKSDNAKVTQVEEKESFEQTDFTPESKVESFPEIENHSEQTGEVFKLLKSNKKGMSTQALFDALTDNTFGAIDDIFSELKKLIEQKMVIQAGEGENSTFKVTKK